MTNRMSLRTKQIYQFYVYWKREYCVCLSQWILWDHICAGTQLFQKCSHCSTPSALPPQCWFVLLALSLQTFIVHQFFHCSDYVMLDQVTSRGHRLCFRNGQREYRFQHDAKSSLLPPQWPRPSLLQRISQLGNKRFNSISDSDFRSTADQTREDENSFVWLSPCSG